MRERAGGHERRTRCCCLPSPLMACPLMTSTGSYGGASVAAAGAVEVRTPLMLVYAMAVYLDLKDVFQVRTRPNIPSKYGAPRRVLAQPPPHERPAAD